jgi:hypothetical protein
MNINGENVQRQTVRINGLDYEVYKKDCVPARNTYEVDAEEKEVALVGWKTKGTIKDSEGTLWVENVQAIETTLDFSECTEAEILQAAAIYYGNKFKFGDTVEPVTSVRKLLDTDGRSKSDSEKFIALAKKLGMDKAAIQSVLDEM